MKKLIFTTLSLLMTTTLLSAQDTLGYGAPWYLYNDGYPDRFCNFNSGASGVGSYLYAVQAYVAPSTGENILYGIALTMSIEPSEMNLAAALFRKTGEWWVGENAAGTYRKASFKVIDSIGPGDCLRKCRFRYLSEEADTIDVSGCATDKYMNYSYEYYFKHPIAVTDTIYVGFILLALRPYEERYGLGVGMDATCSQRWWMGGIYDTPESGFVEVSAESLHSNFYNLCGTPIALSWGGVFPIVKIRCTEPRVPVLEEERGDTLVLRFPDDGEEHVYEVAWAHINSMVDTNNAATIVTSTADGRVVLGGLQPGERYWYRARRSCTLATSGYSQTVWTPWGTGYYVPGRSGGLGIRELPQEPAFDLHPNPAVGEVTLTGLQPGATLQVVDPQGRLHATHTVRQPQMTLDLGALPRGLYLVRQTCATGTSTRKLAVER